jgi:glutamyl-tRNA reductase
MALLLVGTSHERAPVELRERLYLRDPETGELARRLADGGGEAVALSTCNRTELYLVDGEPDTAETRAFEELANRAGMSRAQIEPSLYALRDEAAAVHLFRVAAGLDSLIPGEAQILGQVRGAYESACEVESVGGTLHRLFGQALRVGRRVRSETAIGENPASVSSAAAELAGRVLGDLRGRKILVIGAGKMSDLAARASSSPTAPSLGLRSWPDASAAVPSGWRRSKRSSSTPTWSSPRRARKARC